MIGRKFAYKNRSSNNLPTANRTVKEKMTLVLNSPTEESVSSLLNAMNNNAYTVSNDPRNWNALRGLWNVVNRSNQVTTASKEKLLAALMMKGLEVSNTKVIDNYIH